MPVAVVAEDVHYPLSQLIRHRHVLDLSIQVLVLLRHVAEAFEAQWALILVLGQLLEALLMHGVATVEED
jgi:hypothetical protein